MDEEGFVYITGRASDMYISGGSNVYPREAEEKILTHPAVAEVAILGVPDSTWGEVGVAVCVLRPDATLHERPTSWRGLRARSLATSSRRGCLLGCPPKSGYGKNTKKDVRAELEARGCLPLINGPGRRPEPRDAFTIPRALSPLSGRRIWSNRRQCL